jgi:ribosomal protein S18 acetylase RimI-like enzyme
MEERRGMRDTIIKNRKKNDVTDEALYALSLESYRMWQEQGLKAPWMHRSLEEFQRIIHGVTVFVALDAETEELLGMHCFRAYRRQGWCYGFLLAVAVSARREGIASRMLEYEVERIRQSGFHYIKEVTATTADWSIRWHLRNGFRIIGYYHSPNDNFANYVFRKQLISISLSSPSSIAFILRHPFYALHSSAAFCRLRFYLSYAVNRLTKDADGRDNFIGRVARKMIHQGH